MQELYVIRYIPVFLPFIPEISIALGVGRCYVPT